MRLWLFLFLFVLLVTGGCANKEEKQKQKEEEAKKLLLKGRQLVTIGKQFEGFEIYQKIAEEYPDTKVAADIIAAMEAKGYSISNFRVSYTAQKLIQFENRVIEFIRDNGRYPRPGEIRAPIDAWGNPVVFVLREKSPTHDFLIMSKGKDQLPNTSDDSVVVHQRDESLFKQAKRERRSKAYNQRQQGKRSQRGSVRGGANALGDAENMLNALQNSAGGTSQGNEAMTLDDIGAMMGKKNKKTSRKGRIERDAKGLEEIQQLMGVNETVIPDAGNPDEDFEKFMQQQ